VKLANFNFSFRTMKHTCLQSTWSLLFLALPYHAWALVTASGTSISNIATVDYVLGTSPPTVVTSNTIVFLVDKIINLSVIETTGNVTFVNVGQMGVATTFKVTNQGNDRQGYTFAAAVAAAPNTPAPNGAAPFITNDFNAALAANVFVDSNNDGVYQPLLDTATSIADLAPGVTSPTLFVIGDIPGSVLNDQQSVVSLTATTIALAGDPALPTPVAALASVNTANGVEVVYADTAGVTDSARNGQHSAYAAYLAKSPDVTLNKTIVSVTTSSGTVETNPATNDPAIRPGSTLTYQLVASFTGAGTITSLAITDDLLPSNTTYVPNSITVNGVAQTDAADSPIDNTSFAGSTVTVTRGTVTVPAPSVTIQFQAKIN
jgi:uncharacterized repeat protein (TIGR01451 family)